MMIGRQKYLDSRIKTQSRPAVGEKERHIIGPAAQLLSRPAVFEFGGHHYLPVKTADGWQSWLASCPHMGAELDAGCFQSSTARTEEPTSGNRLQCPWHGYRFDTTSGRCLKPEQYRLKKGPAIVEEKGVLYAVEA